MKELINPTFFILSSIYGMISGYLAYRRQKNPYLWFLIGFCFGLIGIAFFLIPQKKRNARIKQEPIMVLHGPTDKLWFYLDPTHQQVGPMSYNGILKAFSEKTISKETYVWHENLTEWKKLSELYQQINS
ncbi:MAG TPA: DUF4339 domain-containing protein [Chlamydiales bacterium]|nr:DUF4339 domain-containing protein [Chlamydiales bacterium]